MVPQGEFRSEAEKQIQAIIDRDSSRTSGFSRESYRSEAGRKKIKIVIVGDTTVGKTALMRSYLSSNFSEDDYTPTVLDVYKGRKNVESTPVDVEIHDTSGDENLSVSRHIQYNDTDLFVLCVAVDLRASFQNVKRWVSEIKQAKPDAPIALILTKRDLVEIVEDPVTIDQLQEQGKKLGCEIIKETSSKEYSDFNVMFTFSECLTTAFHSKYFSQ